ncbi:MAG: hypothetical protein ACKO2K_20130 [Alphaproteobacteria bacterium]
MSPAGTHLAERAAVFLVSLAAILLEIAWTRVFSFKLFYYFSYFVVGVAMLGLGAGGVAVAIDRKSAARTTSTLAAWCAAGAAATVAGYVFIALCPMNLFSMVGAIRSRDDATSARELSRLLTVCVVLVAPFLAAGVVLATIFSRRTLEIGRLYFADLLGAGLGCALAVPVMMRLSPPGTLMVAGGLLATAGLVVARSTPDAHVAGGADPGSHVAVPPGAACPGTPPRGLQPVLAALAALALLGAARPGLLPDPVPDAMKVRPSAGARSYWHPVFRVDVLESPDPDRLLLVHDGTVGSSVRRFDGRLEDVRAFDADDRSLPFSLLRPEPDVAIVGSAGGNEILASLHFGARRVTAVELNPVTVGLLRGELADWSGRLAEHPKVDLVNAEGRSYLEASRGGWDLVWLVAPDSYAAMNAATAGGFVLSESYLYTREMIAAALSRLAPGGILCVQFGEADFDRKPNRTLRFLASARAAFEQLRPDGQGDFAGSVLVATAPYTKRFSSSTIVLRNTPFTPGEVLRFQSALAAIPGAVLHREPFANGGGSATTGGEAIDRVVSLPREALASWHADQPFDVRPVSDDSPFFWHFVRFGDLLAGREWPGTPFLEEGLGERVLLSLLAVVTLLAGLLLLAPFALVRDAWPGTTRETLAAGLYFALIGLGFMFLEIILIQRLTLLLGYPTRSLSVTLFALLLSGGIGSLLSARLPATGADFARMASVLLLLGFVLQHFVLPRLPGLLPWPISARIAVAVAILAPLGLCLGSFLPLGLRVVAAGRDDRAALVAWSWAVNGFFSVVSSVLATMLSMSLGFDLVMTLGLALYAAAAIAIATVAPAAGGRDGSGLSTSTPVV